MPRAKRPEYDSAAFADRWHSREPLADIASDLGVSIAAVWRAASRRGWRGRLELKAIKGLTDD